jgi:hypothetical protein
MLLYASVSVDGCKPEWQISGEPRKPVRRLAATRRDLWASRRSAAVLAVAEPRCPAGPATRTPAERFRAHLARSDRWASWTNTRAPFASSCTVTQQLICSRASRIRTSPLAPVASLQLVLALASSSLGEICPGPRLLSRVTVTKPGTAASLPGDLSLIYRTDRWADVAAFAGGQAGAGSTTRAPLNYLA